MGIRESCEALGCQHGHAEFYRVKHQISRIGEQSTVIGKSHQSCDFQLFSSYCDGVSHRKGVIVRIHPVDGDLVGRLRKCALHQADQVHFFPFFEDTHGAV